jgi:hypothetical protein
LFHFLPRSDYARKTRKGIVGILKPAIEAKTPTVSRAP